MTLLIKAQPYRFMEEPMEEYIENMEKNNKQPPTATSPNLEIMEIFM